MPSITGEITPKEIHCYRCLGRGASWLNPPKPRKSEIDIYVPSLIVKVVGREEGREVYSVV